MDYKKLLKHLTLFDKASLLVGYANMSTRPMPSLDIPPLIMSDGPNGIRKESEGGDVMENGFKTLPATCFPCGSTIANSWDNDLFYRIGRQIGLECRYYGINAILGPAINIKRNPLCGRNFEYLSEDPLLAGYLSANYIKGVQEQDVLACVKHYACNNNETYRYVGDSIVDLRALNDIYLKPFEIAIREANPGMLMTSYNKVNGTFASENVYLITNRLRRKFNYQGLTVTDWGGVVNRDISLNAGQDLEMPGMVKENIQKIVDGVKNRLITMDTVDQSLIRLFEAIDKTRAERILDDKIFEESNKLALEAALRSAVLLKNDNETLPLNRSKKYAVIGDLFENMHYQGGGSALINAKCVTSNKQAFDSHGVFYFYAPGYNSFNLNVNPVWESDAINIAKDADTVIFFAGTNDQAECEGYDRATMKLDNNQVHLLERLVDLNKKIVLVLFAGGPVEIPCIDKIDAILFMSLPGQNGGEATRQLLFGEAQPTGKLSYTWPNKYEDVPFGNEYAKTPNEQYKESIYVGYRYYTSAKKVVLYPFGFGLTYSKYTFENLVTEVKGQTIHLTLDVINQSDFPTSAIVQVYVSKMDSNIPRPEKELKTYARIDLNENEKQTIKLEIKVADLAVYDRKTDTDVVESGEYAIFVSKDVETDVLDTSVVIKGKKLESLETDEAYYDATKLNELTQEQFETMLGRHIEPYKPSEKPYTLETPLSEFKTFTGKLVRNEINKQATKMAKGVKKIKDEQTKQRLIKSANFFKRSMKNNCLRCMCFSTSGYITLKQVQGILDIANGRIIRGMRRLKHK